MEEPNEAIAAISISEIEQRQKRRDNIVVFGLDEPDTAEDRKKPGLADRTQGVGKN